MDEFAKLRPVERRMTRLAAEGVVPDEIGRRFNRSGDFVERVLEFASLPGRGVHHESQALRPLERRLLRWRDEGATPAELADRFRRGTGYIERVLAYADYKQRRAGA
jgi:DNA-binding CsgD family transcriptional regulator